MSNTNPYCLSSTAKFWQPGIFLLSNMIESTTLLNSHETP